MQTNPKRRNHLFDRETAGYDRRWSWRRIKGWFQAYWPVIVAAMIVVTIIVALFAHWISLGQMILGGVGYGFGLAFMIGAFVQAPNAKNDREGKGVIGAIILGFTLLVITYIVLRVF